MHDAPAELTHGLVRQGPPQYALSMSTYTDYNWIIPNRIAQGGYPGASPSLFQTFDVVVYMAMEAQPKMRLPPGKIALYGPIDDDIYRPLPREVGAELHKIAAECARQAAWGKKVLITCMQGKNRSGLITALTLLKMYPAWTPEQAITIIRRNRRLRDGSQALGNTMFEMYIMAHGRNP